MSKCLTKSSVTRNVMICFPKMLKFYWFLWASLRPPVSFLSLWLDCAETIKPHLWPFAASAFISFSACNGKWRAVSIRPFCIFLFWHAMTRNNTFNQKKNAPAVFPRHRAPWFPSSGILVIWPLVLWRRPLFALPASESVKPVSYLQLIYTFSPPILPLCLPRNPGSTTSIVHYIVCSLYFTILVIISPDNFYC